ncbi:hypothetical protein ACGH7X_23875 [Streptomyces sp. BBFR51]|uniref:hypothetical protein n=1 Tax=Streptomyces sp. BBFR51 TaxID=3372856 RepID=UPI0037DD2156
MDTVARLFEQTLTGSGWFEQWGCVLAGVRPRREEPDVPEGRTSSEGVDVEFHQIQAPGERACCYGYEFFVTRDQSVEEEVRRLAAFILADDPRKTAELRER